MKKIAIIGFAESWKQAPWKDPGVEFWALNEFWKYAPLWHRWFELHDAETLGVTTRDLSEGEQRRHLEWLKQKHNKPIYMQPQFCDGRFPDAVPYPLEAMIEKYGRYFTSSIGYMMAMALEENPDWIGLYGVDLASDVEYPGQRPNTEYFVGIAKGRGIQVDIASTSALLKGGALYGYEKDVATQVSPLIAFAQKQKAIMATEHEKKLAELNTLDGAMQAYENVINAERHIGRGVQF